MNYYLCVDFLNPQKKMLQHIYIQTQLASLVYHTYRSLRFPTTPLRKINSTMGNRSSNTSKPLPIETLFKFPADIPVWPQGSHFISLILFPSSNVYMKQLFDLKWSVQAMDLALESLI